jgi:RimJ/RimL family protein N-acetyltransferase
MVAAGLVVPELTTERLMLVPLSRDHRDGMFALFADPEVCRFSGRARDAQGQEIVLPVTVRADSDRIVALFLAGAAQGGWFRWAVLRREDRRFLGAAGFNRLGEVSEIAYHLLPEFWGSGVMREAAGAALEWVGARPGHRTVEAKIQKGNRRSVALAASIGFDLAGEDEEGRLRFMKTL